MLSHTVEIRKLAGPWSLIKGQSSGNFVSQKLLKNFLPFLAKPCSRKVLARIETTLPEISKRKKPTMTLGVSNEGREETHCEL